MNSSNIIASLKTLSSDLLDKTLAEIRLHREQSSPPKEAYFLTAEYFLQEAMEYVTGAWEMIESGKSNASIALSRWSLEASLNLLWTVADSDKIEERHRVLIGEALRLEACLYEGYAELWPDKKELYKGIIAKARGERKNLCVEKPEDLNTRLESIKKQFDNDVVSILYPLYRICCAAAHPNLNVWKRFELSGGTIVSKEPIDKQSTACWMAVTSTLYLVACTYCLTELGDVKQLKDWRDNKVGPLLEQI